jgi:uncharacterized protein
MTRVKASPVSAEERIAELDVLRGFALFGIFLVNMPTFLQPDLFLPEDRLPLSHTALDEWIRLLFDMFVQAKFYTIFSFLFGAGFYLFMSRAEQKGHAATRLYLRRLTVLMLFGVVHLLFFWYGDILHTYALAGLCLLWFYKRQEASIRRAALLLLIGWNLLMALTLLVPGESSYSAETWQRAQEAITVYNQGGPAEWLQFRWTHEMPIVLEYEWMNVLSVLPLFLMGLYAAKKGVFHRPEQHAAAIKRVWLLALAASVPLVAMIPPVQSGAVDLPAPPELAVLVFIEWSGLSLCALYITSLLLLLRTGRGRKLLAPLAPVGRMALTNYLAQTVLSLGIARLFHLYGQAEMWLGLVLCLVIFPLQTAWSRWWLSRYRFGPLEWLWRCLTYGFVPPMKR